MKQTLVGIKTACKILDLSETAVRRMTRRGALPCARDDQNRRRFRVDELEKLARARRTAK